MGSKKKLTVENQDLCRQIEETENAIAALGKGKISLTTQLEDTKRLGDSEARDRASLKGLSKATAEAQLWRSKYETEGLGHVEELEAGRQKLSARLNEAEETIDSLNAKVAATEKNQA